SLPKERGSGSAQSRSGSPDEQHETLPRGGGRLGHRHWFWRTTKSAGHWSPAPDRGMRAVARRSAGHRLLAPIRVPCRDHRDSGPAPGTRTQCTHDARPRKLRHRIGAPASRHQAFTQANIYARASGYISRRAVDIGSAIKTGQLLVAITAPEVDHQIAQAEGTLASVQAVLERATANRDLAQDTWNRDSRLVQQGDLSEHVGDTDRLNLEARIAAVAVAAANVQAQAAQLNVLRQQKAYQIVLAPFNGVITQRNVDVGDLVQADATSGPFLFTVMETDTVRIQLYVPQGEAFGVAPGVEAVLRVPEIPDRTFPGTVTRTANALQLDTRTLLTEIDVPNPDQALSPGLYCTVELKIPRKTPSLIVPSDALIFNRNGFSVGVVEDGITRIRPVNVVRHFGTTVEVNRGINDGDQVILMPPVDLTEGHRVS